MTAAAQNSLLAHLDTQPRVRDFLSRAVATDRASHAYLFVGAPGSGKLDAAWALAQALLCENGGCGACDSCVRVARRSTAALTPPVQTYSSCCCSGRRFDVVRFSAMPACEIGASPLDEVT